MNKEIQELIQKTINLDRIKTSIEVIRSLEMYNYVHPEYYNDEQGASPSFYLMYKDLHAVERILLNQYGNDLGLIYWKLYKYITNTTQSFLFEEIFNLRTLQQVLEDRQILEPTSQYSKLRWFDGFNYIEKRDEIMTAFKAMLDWIDQEITKKQFPMKRDAYNPEFKP